CLPPAWKPPASFSRYLGRSPYFSCFLLILILPYSNDMSKEKVKNNNWGGKRAGAGRPAGTAKKVKICVSVNRQNWQDALSSWTGKASHLVEKLVSAYVKQGESSQSLEAIT